MSRTLNASTEPDELRTWFEDLFLQERRFLSVPRSVWIRSQEEGTGAVFWGTMGVGWHNHPLLETIDSIEKGVLQLRSLFHPGRKEPHLVDMSVWMRLEEMYRFTPGSAGRILLRDGTIAQYLSSHVRIKIGQHGTPGYYENEDTQFLVLVRTFTPYEITTLVRQAVGKLHDLRHTNPLKALRLAEMALAGKPPKKTKKVTRSARR